jgi:hypothetical protein
MCRADSKVLQCRGTNGEVLQCWYNREQYSVIMIVDNFDMAITISGHSCSIHLVVLSHARRPVHVESAK